MEIRCPQCIYTREIDEETLSPSVTLATCPQCGLRFRFRESVSADFELSGADSEEQKGDAGTASAESLPETPEWARLNEAARPERPFVSAPQSDDALLPSWAKKKAVSLEPWAQYKVLGILPAFLTTTKQILLAPQHFFAAMSRDVKFTIPFSYYMIASLSGILLETLWQTALGNPILPEAFSSAVQSPEEMLWLAMYSPVVMTLYLYALGGVLHLCLLLSGVAKGGASATLRVVCYSGAADLLSIIPVVGSLAGGIVRLWLLVVGLKTVHGANLWRVLPAVGVMLLVLLVFVAVLMRGVGIV